MIDPNKQRIYTSVKAMQAKRAGRTYEQAAALIGVAPAVAEEARKAIEAPATATSAQALAAIAQQDSAAKSRAVWIAKMKALKPYNGVVSVAGVKYTVKNGSLSFGGVNYQVSKDGRAVINRNLAIVGEIKGGIMGKPTAAFLAEMKQYGEAY